MRLAQVRTQVGSLRVSFLVVESPSLCVCRLGLRRAHSKYSGHAFRPVRRCSAHANNSASFTVLSSKSWAHLPGLVAHRMDLRVIQLVRTFLISEPNNTR